MEVTGRKPKREHKTKKEASRTKRREAQKRPKNQRFHKAMTELAGGVAAEAWRGRQVTKCLVERQVKYGRIFLYYQHCKFSFLFCISNSYRVHISYTTMRLLMTVLSGRVAHGYFSRWHRAAYRSAAAGTAATHSSAQSLLCVAAPGRGDVTVLVLVQTPAVTLRVLVSLPVLLIWPVLCTLSWRRTGMNQMSAA